MVVDTPQVEEIEKFSVRHQVIEQDLIGDRPVNQISPAKLWLSHPENLRFVIRRSVLSLLSLTVAFLFYPVRNC